MNVIFQRAFWLGGNYAIRIHVWEWFLNNMNFNMCIAY